MGTGESHDQKSFSLRNSFLFSAKGNKSSQPTVQREALYQLEARQIERLDRTFWGVGGTQPAGTAGEGVAMATAEGRAEVLTYPAADGDQELSNCLRVVHHHRLHSAIQHADFLRPLFLLVLQDILDTSGAPHTEWKNTSARDTFLWKSISRRCRHLPLCKTFLKAFLSIHGGAAVTSTANSKS